MNKQLPVPRLNLAPKLNRPLSLWNPLDYLRLLYWVFYFPQALRCYVQKFGDEKSWDRQWNRQMWRLKLQGSILMIVTYLNLWLVLKKWGLVISGRLIADRSAVLVCIVLSVALGMKLGIGTGMAYSVSLAAAQPLFKDIWRGLWDIMREAIPCTGSNMLDPLLGGVNVSIAYGIATGVFYGTAMGIMGGTLWSLAWAAEGERYIDSRTLYSVLAGSTIGVLHFLWFAIVCFMMPNSRLSVFTVALIAVLGILFGGVTYVVAYSVAYGAACGLISLRLDSWFLGVLFNFLPLSSQSWSFPRITRLPLPHLTSRLHLWLQQDWIIGLENINQVWAYSFQIKPAINALNRALAELPPEQLIFRMAQVTRTPQTWDLIKFASVSWQSTRAKKSTLSWINVLLWFLRQDELGTYLSVYVAPSVDNAFTLGTPTKAAEERDFYLAFIEDKLKTKVRRDISERAAVALVSWYLSHTKEQWLNTLFRFDTPARAAAAGFWYLHAGYPQQAKEAFEVVRSLLYGEEMYDLALTLAIFMSLPVEEDIVSLDEIATLKSWPLPSEPQLRPTSWQAIQRFYNAVEEIKIVQQGLSRSSRSLAFNRALGELIAILDTIDTLPEAERNLIQKIAERWKASLLKVSAEIGNIQITSPVRNPYVVGDPVEGSLFVGREDILRELEELWLRSNHRPSVVLYGHRRMGKTSILRNLTQFAGEDCCVIYINLQGLGAVSRGTGEVLIAIADKIAAALNIAPPDDTELLSLPERTFERFLQRVFQQMQARSLIVALDEFETLESLIEAGKIPPDFLAYLRSLIQMDARLAFAFAGLHTLQEMTADYFQPFFASVVPIRVSFLELGATRQLLANPEEDFPLDYTREACDRVHTLTRGQPFLVQLLGFQLVRRYNRTMFEEGRKRDSAFGVADVDSAINDEFFQRGRYYFEGVARQAARGAAGQGEILRVLAPHRGGLNEAELRANLELDKELDSCIDWDEALATLKRHDVIEERSGKWCIAVELFRLWYLQRNDGI